MNVIMKRMSGRYMPLYEYECMSCGECFDVIHGMEAPPPEKCIKCGSAIRRLYKSAPVVNYMGSGFHVNDYSSTGAKSNE